MRFLEGRAPTSAGWDLNAASSGSPLAVIRSARDPVKFPDDPTITKIVADSFCIGGLGENCYTIKNVYGDTRRVPYGSSLETWKLLTQELKDIAMLKADEEISESLGKPRG